MVKWWMVKWCNGEIKIRYMCFIYDPVLKNRGANFAKTKHKTKF